MKLFPMPPARFVELYADDDGAIIATIPLPEFIRMATYCPDAPGDFDESRVAEWEDWPKLIIDPEEGVCFSHEGRHRCAVLLNAGYDAIEIVVEITPNPRRFENDVAAMLAWEWSGNLPSWAEIKPEQEWLDAIHS